MVGEVPDRILDSIEAPCDVKSLDDAQLTTLAAEIREVLINTVSATGGHLAPNLGVVELTLGMHRALDCPDDKIIWDVGHQSYVHKLVTGRRVRFSTPCASTAGCAGSPSGAKVPTTCSTPDTHRTRFPLRSGWRVRVMPLAAMRPWSPSSVTAR